MNWFTSDPHYWHENILRYCPKRGALWNTVEEMNEGLIERWNSVVKPADTVYVLGDLCFKNSKLRWPEICPRLGGKKILVRGNHDPHPNKFYYDSGFFQVLKHGVVTMDGQHFFMQHHPPTFVEAERGSMVTLCGHVHDLWAEKPEIRTINVGVDVRDFTPISGDAIVAIARSFPL